jgi:uncharacterized protein CbrC (UPF0167 family)
MASKLDRVIDELNEFLELTVKRLTAEVVAELVEANPVQTGWSRANWVPGTGDNVAVEPVGTRQSVSTSERDLGLALILSSYEIEQGRVTIQNNVPYITTINDFHPTRAGFVQESIDRAVSSIAGGTL